MYILIITKFIDICNKKTKIGYITNGDKVAKYLYLETNKELINKKNELINEKKKKDIIIKYYKDTSNKNGNYYTLYFEKNNIYLKKELKKVFKTLLNKYSYKKTLVIGLGNHLIPCDTLGIMTSDKIKVTNHYNDFFTIPKIISFNPDVITNTGLDSYNVIKMLVDKLNPDLIIIIDSLHTNNYLHLGKVLEISDVGLIDKERIKNNKEITKETFNIPIISFGIPFVIDIDNTFLTTINCQEQIKNLSKIISEVINEVLIS